MCWRKRGAVKRELGNCCQCQFDRYIMYRCQQQFQNGDVDFQIQLLMKKQQQTLTWLLHCNAIVMHRMCLLYEE